MSFRGTRLNSSILRRERVLLVEAKAALPMSFSEEKIKEIAASTPALTVDGGNAKIGFQEDQIVIDGGKA